MTMIDTFSGVFYIYKTGSGNFNLCHSQTHLCLACGEYGTVLKSAEDLVVRYKTPETISFKIQNRQGGKLAMTTLEERKKVVKSKQYKKYEKDLNTAIQRGLKRLKDSLPFNRVQNVLKKRKEKGITTPVIKQEVSPVAPSVTTQPKVGKLVVKKPKVFHKV